MALTKVGKEGITGISNSSDATAITITSSENIGVGNTTPDSFSVNASQRLVVGSGSGSQGLTVYAGNASYSSVSFADGTSGAEQYAGFLNYNHNGDVLQVGIGGSERVRFTTGGIAIGGTGAANTLNDYEEGTFTPTLASGVSISSYDIQRGSYTKIGNTVILAAQVEVNGSSRTGSQVSIGGLPFAAVNDGNKPTHGGYITYQSGFSSAINQLFIGSSGNDLLSFHELDGSSLIGSELSGASFEVRVVAIYKTS